MKRVEVAAADVGLVINGKKTEYMSFNQTGNALITQSNKELKPVELSVRGSTPRSETSKLG